jgi:hypothetical protein
LNSVSGWSAAVLPWLGQVRVDWAADFRVGALGLLCWMWFAESPARLMGPPQGVGGGFVVTVEQDARVCLAGYIWLGLSGRVVAGFDDKGVWSWHWVFSVAKSG